MFYLSIPNVNHLHSKYVHSHFIVSFDKANNWNVTSLHFSSVQLPQPQPTSLYVLADTLPSSRLSGEWSQSIA